MTNILILVTIKNPANFIRSILGESKKNIKAILKVIEGKVLIINKVYILYLGSTSINIISNLYKTTIINIILTKV